MKSPASAPRSGGMHRSSEGPRRADGGYFLSTPETAAKQETSRHRRGLAGNASAPWNSCRRWSSRFLVPARTTLINVAWGAWWRSRVVMGAQPRPLGSNAAVTNFMLPRELDLPGRHRAGRDFAFDEIGGPVVRLCFLINTSRGTDHAPIMGRRYTLDPAILSEGPCWGSSGERRERCSRCDDGGLQDLLRTGEGLQPIAALMGTMSRRSRERSRHDQATRRS